MSRSDGARKKEYALEALPKYEKALKLFPENESMRVMYAVLLDYADRSEEAKAAARKLGDLKDGGSIYSTACLQCALKDYEAGLVTFLKAINAGFRNIRLLKLFLEDDYEGISTLKGTPRWDEARLMVEKIETDAEGKKND